MFMRALEERENRMSLSLSLDMRACQSPGHPAESSPPDFSRQRALPPPAHQCAPESQSLVNSQHDAEHPTCLACTRTKAIRALQPSLTCTHRSSLLL